MWIMVGGPYTSGAENDKDRQKNLEAMNEAALAVFETGHVPSVYSANRRNRINSMGEVSW